MKHSEKSIFVRETLLQEQGYKQSLLTCDQCHNHIWTRFSKKPTHWESDVMTYITECICPHCKAYWVERDFD